MKNNNQVSEIGKRIKLARIEKDLSREDLASSINISPDTIKRIENGANFSMDTFIKIANGLNVSADFLCFGKKNQAIFDLLLTIYEGSGPEAVRDMLKKLREINI